MRPHRSPQPRGALAPVLVASRTRDALAGHRQALADVTLLEAMLAAHEHMCCYCDSRVVVAQLGASRLRFDLSGEPHACEGAA